MHSPRNPLTGLPPPPPSSAFHAASLQFCVLLVGVCCMLSIPSTYVMLSDPPEQDPSHPQGIKFYPYKNLPIKEY